MNLRSGIKEVIRLSLPKQVRTYYQGVGTILVYHRLTLQEPSYLAFRPNLVLAVHQKNFEEQLIYLSKNYQCLSFNDFYQGIVAGNLPKNAVTLTFDDGYLDNLELALPLLEKYKIPAMIYITINNVETDRLLWWYELEMRIRANSFLSFDWEGGHYEFPLKTVQQKRMVYQTVNYISKNLSNEKQEELLNILAEKMPKQLPCEVKGLSWDNLKQLASSEMISIGTHTLSHPNLRLCNVEQLHDELLIPRLKLEEFLGRKVDHTSFPFGDREHSMQREMDMAKDLGYLTACTTRIGHVQMEHKDNLFALPRIGIGYKDTISTLRWKLSGAYAMLKQRGKRVITL